MTAAIETDQLTKRFGAVGAVDGLNLTVSRGEMFALVGPDGAGKTTTVRMLCGILPPDGGSASVLGFGVHSAREQIKQRIGYLSQRFSLYGDLTVDENITFFAEIHSMRDYESRRDELLQFTRLTEFRDRLADRLSGGMKQKLALACTLIHRPELLILDEPTTGVDPVSRRDFWVILQNLLRDGMTIFLTTPYLDEAERCSRVALMNHGTILDEGDPASLRSHIAGEVIEIVCRPVRNALTALRSAGLFDSVQAFGDRVHVISSGSLDTATAARKILEAEGIEVSSIRPVRPSLENVFISLMSTGEAQQ